MVQLIKAPSKVQTPFIRNPTPLDHAQLTPLFSGLFQAGSCKIHHPLTS